MERRNNCCKSSCLMGGEGSSRTTRILDNTLADLLLVDVVNIDQFFEIVLFFEFRMNWRQALESPHPAARLDRNGNLLDDLQPEAFQCRNVHGGIRQQSDAPDSQVR